MTILKLKNPSPIRAFESITALAKHFGVTRMTATRWRDNGRLFEVTVVGRAHGKPAKEYVAWHRPDDMAKYSHAKSLK